ncbi:ATP-binding protein [Persephonella sp.]|uniref:ATP-binding protein n=1 Tax=Persephonella sp. TaxID=2060922 RepID=UPI002602B011|nr:ATP-binding protein [Persephonella sp.]
MKRKEIFKELIVEFQNRQLPTVINRNIEVPINTKKIISIIGVRRSGKTFVLFQTIKKLLNDYKIPIERIVYINFEDERLEITKEDLNQLIEAYTELYPDISLDKVYFFFDEIQNVQGWEKFVRRIYDSYTKNIFITGSNSKLLSSEIATSLRGRSISFTVYPLSFKEFIKFKNIKTKKTDIYDIKKRAKIKSLFLEYMEFGGFPEIVFLEDENLKIKVLQEYFEVMLYRDIIERFQIKNPLVLKYFVKRVVENVGKPLSVNNIYNELKSQGFKLAKDSLYSYLEMLEAIFFSFIVKKYTKSVLKSELTHKKVYLIDNGFLNALSFLFKEKKGALLENILVKEFKAKGNEVFYFKEKKECDFIVVDAENNLIPVQVSFSLVDKETRKREIEGLIEALKFLGLDKGLIITLDEKEELKMNNYKIDIIPAYEYLLQL